MDKVDQELKKIYTDPKSGELEDVSRLIIQKSSPMRFVVYILLGVLILLALILWYALFGRPADGQYSGKSVDIKISSKLNIASGDEVRYTIEYSGKDKIRLLNAEMIIKFPDGFTFISASPDPKNQYNNIWELGALEKGRRGLIEIVGTIIGELGSLQTLDATISYVPENFSSTFKEHHSFTSQIISSILNITLNGPEHILREKEETFTILLHNTSERDLNNIGAVVVYPEGFLFISSDPKPSLPPLENEQATGNQENNNTWFFDLLESGGEKTIEIQGKFEKLKGTQNSAAIKAQAGFLEKEGEFTVQLEDSLQIALIDHNLKIDMFINGQQSDGTVNFGDTLNYIIVYKNLGQETLGQFQIIADVQSSLLDWSTLTDKNLGKVRDGTITYDHDSFVTYTQIQPLDEATIEFSIQVKDLEQVDISKEALEIKSMASAVIGTINDIPADITIKTKEIIHTLNTALKLVAQGRYFNDDNIAVGSGPLPMVVGKKTTFRIYWFLSNSIHQVESVSVNTELPNGVEWDSKTLSSIGQISYEQDKKVVTWSIPEILPQQSFEKVNAWFDVSVTPTQELIGKIMLLTTETNLTASDTVTDSSVVLLERSITSNLEDDPFGGGRGLVEEPPEQN